MKLKSSILRGKRENKVGCLYKIKADHRKRYKSVVSFLFGKLLEIPAPHFCGLQMNDNPAGNSGDSQPIFGQIGTLTGEWGIGRIRRAEEEGVRILIKKAQAAFAFLF